MPGPLCRGPLCLRGREVQGSAETIPVHHPLDRTTNIQQPMARIVTENHQHLRFLGSSFERRLPQGDLKPVNTPLASRDNGQLKRTSISQRESDSGTIILR